MVVVRKRDGQCRVDHPLPSPTRVLYESFGRPASRFAIRPYGPMFHCTAADLEGTSRAPLTTLLVTLITSYVGGFSGLGLNAHMLALTVSESRLSCWYLTCLTSLSRYTMRTHVHVKQRSKTGGSISIERNRFDRQTIGCKGYMARNQLVLQRYYGYK